MNPMSFTSSMCPACGSRDVMSVDLALLGSAIAFSFCTSCEWKGWVQEGQDLPLTSVLGMVSSR